MTLAFDKPEVYATQFARRMKARSLSSPPKNLPWIALIDGLSDAGALAEVDHREDTAQLKRAINGLSMLPKATDRWKWLNAFSEEDLEDMDLAELLEHVGSHLSDEGFTLAQLDMGSDAFPLVAIRREDASRIVSLGKTAGYGDVDLFTGSDLPEMQRVRKERVGRQAASVAPPVVSWRCFIRENEGRIWSVLPTGTQVRHETCLLGHDLEKSVTDVPSNAQALAEADRLIAQRIAEGYVPISLEEFRRRDAEETARLEAAAKTAQTRATATAAKPKAKPKR